MNNEARRHRLATAYVKCKQIMEHGEAPLDDLRKIEDIMLASIRTLHFIWDSNADKSMDYILESILRYMAMIAANAITGDQDKIYIEMIS